MQRRFKWDYGVYRDDELIQSNQVTGITKKLKLNRIKKEIEPLKESEAVLLLESSKGYGPDIHTFFVTAVHTGMRLGELSALKWSDIDYNSKFIWVKRSYRRGRITTPENGKSRKVDMSETLISALRLLETKRKKEALKSGFEMPELIFHRNGKAYPQNFMAKVLKRILKKAKMREIRFHDLRHSYASILLSRGVSPVYVKNQLGHSSVEITVDIYCH